MFKSSISEFIAVLATIFFFICPSSSSAWHDETHLAIAKAAGYQKWYNAAGPDIAKIKAGDKEAHDHYSNNPHDVVVTPKMIQDQVNRYNDPTDEKTGVRDIG
ncbi:MAG: hypothetical protein ACLQBD_05600 [Syntrophobacteraceae bacterium]